MPAPTLQPLDRSGLALAQEMVAHHHYLHAKVDRRTRLEGYGVHVPGLEAPAGCLLVGRPEATRCYPWYGSVADVASGRAMATRWEVLNLSRVWLSPAVQSAAPGQVPGFVDRRGIWRSTLASTVLRLLVERVGYEYLLARPPCFLDEPFEIRWLLSYCDTSKHKGTIYKAAGFDLYRTNDRGIQTWRIALPPLTPAQEAAVARASAFSERSRRYRAVRATRQLALGI